MTNRKALRIILAVIGIALIALAVVLYFRYVRSMIMDRPIQFRRLHYFLYAPAVYDAAAYFARDSKIPSGLVAGFILFILFVVFLNVYSFSDPVFRITLLTSILLTVGSGLTIRTLFKK